MMSRAHNCPHSTHGKTHASCPHGSTGTLIELKNSTNGKTERAFTAVSIDSTVCFFLSKSRSMAVIWAVYRRLLRLPAGKTSRPVQRPRCPCVAPSRQFSRISAILGAHSPPDPSAERASAPSEPKRGRKSNVRMPLFQKKESLRDQAVDVAAA